MVSEPDMQVALETADVLQDMMAKAEVLAAGYRDNSLPEGALLGEMELQGQQVKWKKQKSMVRSGNTPLPERFEAFDRDGRSSMLPTAQMGRMLSKPRADALGERAFHTHTRGMTATMCKICPEPKQPIEQTCQFCLGRTAGRLRKVFYDETDLYIHETRLHPDELASRERQIERAERNAQIEAQQRVAEAMMAMAKQQAEQARHEPVKTKAT